jgi:hypothetical protein
LGIWHSFFYIVILKMSTGPASGHYWAIYDMVGTPPKSGGLGSSGISGAAVPSATTPMAKPAVVTTPMAKPAFVTTPIPSSTTSRTVSSAPIHSSSASVNIF